MNAGSADQRALAQEWLEAAFAAYPASAAEFLRRERADADAMEIDLPPQGISLEAIEKELILKALEKCNWNQTRAAHYLDISRKTLIYRMERHGIQKPREGQAYLTAL